MSDDKKDSKLNNPPLKTKIGDRVIEEKTITRHAEFSKPPPEPQKKKLASEL